MEQLTLSARLREKRGKEYAKKLRRNNEMPAIFYGPGTEPVMLSVRSSDLEKIMKTAGSENVLLRLKIEKEDGTDTRTVMIKELQAHPLRDILLHGDFYEVSMDKEITVNISIRLVNTPVGVAKGGILQHTRREINVSCLPNRLMDYIEVDVSSLDVGGALHVQDIQLPEGYTINDEGHLTVAVVVTPKAAKEEVEVEAAEGVSEEAGAEEKAEGS